MDGRRVRFLLVIPVPIVFLMAYNARSQNRSISAEKPAATEDVVSRRAGLKIAVPSITLAKRVRPMFRPRKFGQLLFTSVITAAIF